MPGRNHSLPYSCLLASEKRHRKEYPTNKRDSNRSYNETLAEKARRLRAQLKASQRRARLRAVGLST